jgi:PAS domain S-box-containing protein
MGFSLKENLRTFFLMLNDRDRNHQQLRDELADLRRRFDALLDNLPEGVLIVDAPDVTIRFASRYGRNMIGATQEEILGVSHLDHFRLYQVFNLDGSPAPIESLPLARTLLAGEVICNEEWLMQTRDGRKIPMLCHSGPVRDEKGNIVSAVLSWQDISERKRTEEALQNAHAELQRRIAEVWLNEARLEAVLQLNHMADRSLKEITDFALEQAVSLTKSKLGYLAFVNENETVLTMHSWSKEAMKECSVSDIPRLYPLEETGLWGEAVRQRKPIITNDFASPNPLKKGLPEGHVHLVRHLNVPIFDQGRVVIVAGVGNKDTDYDDSDVRQLTLLMEGLGTIIQRQKVLSELERHRDHLEQLVRDRTEDLRQSRDELQVIFDGMTDGLAILDYESKKFVHVNAVLSRMLGYSEEELLSMSPLDIHPPEEIPAVLNRLKIRMAGWQGSATVPVLRKDGSIFSADIASNPFTFRGRSCIAGFFRDVTERIEAQKALRESEAQYRQIFESVSDILFILENNDHVAAANPAAHAAYGYSREEILGRSIVDFIAPECRHHYDQASKILDEHGVYHAESMNIRKDGTTFQAEVWASEFLIHGKSYSLVVVRDIDQRKQAEEAKLREYRTLKHLLQSSDHERQTIAYEIHDGLAQYLAGSIMQFEVYRHRLKKDPAEADKVFEIAISLLRQGHFEARRLIAGVRPPVLDEAGVVEAIAHLINEQNRQNGPQIEFTSRVKFSRLVPILENAIYRICQEGLSNACKHSQSERVRIRLTQIEDRIRIEIRDWGCGFDLHRIADDHFGLIGIRQRVRLLGGRHRLQSDKTKGTRITVELPIFEREK